MFSQRNTSHIHSADTELYSTGEYNKHRNHPFVQGWKLHLPGHQPLWSWHERTPSQLQNEEVLFLPNLSFLVKYSTVLQSQLHVNFEETPCNGPMGPKELSPCTPKLDGLKTKT